jgi:hypothetical protein
MAGTTTYYGITYPTNTDYVKDGANAIQTVATGFDTAVAIPTYNNQTGTSYTFVLSDIGKTVTASNASASTFTIPPQASVAWPTNATIPLSNLGAGIVTVVGGAGVTVTNAAATLAQYQNANLIRTGSNAWTVAPNSGIVPGLVHLNTTSFSAQTSVSFSSLFSSTYDTYKIFLTLDSVSASQTIRFRLRSNTTDETSALYFFTGISTFQTSSTVTTNNGSTVTSIDVIKATAASGSEMTLYSPMKAQSTSLAYDSIGLFGDVQQNKGGGYYLSASTYNGFTLLSSTGNMTGTVRVFGVRNS